MILKKQRLDQILFNRNLAESKTKAQAMIMAGQVLVEGKTRVKIINTSSKEIFLKASYDIFPEKIKKTISLNKSKDKILDIACNDGTFLKFFVKDKFKNVVGFEPAKNLRYLN